MIALCQGLQTGLRTAPEVKNVNFFLHDLDLPADPLGRAGLHHGEVLHGGGRGGALH